MELVMNILRVGDVHVALWLHTEQDPPESAWDEANARVEQLINSEPGLCLRGLIVTDGGAPSMKQRAQVYAMLRRAKGKFSVVTTVMSSPIKRGVATALRLVNPGFAFFRPEDFRAALEHVDVPPHACGTVMAEYGRMEAQLGPSKTLALIAAGAP
jgi:hypothetical protein